jgi:hypothetical protein
VILDLSSPKGYKSKIMKGEGALCACDLGLAVAVAALRGPELPELFAEDHTAVMRIPGAPLQLRPRPTAHRGDVPGPCRAVRAGAGRAHTHVRTSQAIELLHRIVADSPIARAKFELVRELISSAGTPNAAPPRR